MTTTAEFIARFEGFSARAYWDVNHWRLGYGSDTEGPEQSEVTENSTTTRERALQNLALRIPQFQAAAVSGTPRYPGMGTAAWGRLTDNQVSVITSLVYNYGHLPRSVLLAISDPKKVAASIDALGTANGGVNARRRRVEAEFYLTPDQVRSSSVSPQAQAPGLPGPVLSVPGTRTPEQVISASTAGRRASDQDTIADIIARKRAEIASLTDELAVFERLGRELGNLVPAHQPQAPSSMAANQVAALPRGIKMTTLPAPAKPAISSKSFWGSVITLVVPVVSYVADTMGASVDPKMQMAGSALGGLLALYGTMTRTAPISGIFTVK